MAKKVFNFNRNITESAKNFFKMYWEDNKDKLRGKTYRKDCLLCFEFALKKDGITTLVHKGKEWPVIEVLCDIADMS